MAKNSIILCYNTIDVESYTLNHLFQFFNKLDAIPHQRLCKGIGMKIQVRQHHAACVRQVGVMGSIAFGDIWLG